MSLHKMMTAQPGRVRACIACMLTVASLSTFAQQSSPGDPGDPRASVEPTHYVSAFDGYKPLGEPKAGNWKQANQEVSGGMTSMQGADGMAGMGGMKSMPEMSGSMDMSSGKDAQSMPGMPGMSGMSGMSGAAPGSSQTRGKAKDVDAHSKARGMKSTQTKAGVATPRKSDSMQMSEKDMKEMKGMKDMKGMPMTPDKTDRDASEPPTQDKPASMPDGMSMPKK